MKERKEVLSQEVFLKNEEDANKSLAKGCMYTGIVVAAVFILYLVNVFRVTERTLLLIKIVFPILIVILISTILYTKTRMIKKKSFKYFLITQFIVVVFTLNVLIPKHVVLMWPLVLVIVNHYYNPKVSLFTFIAITFAMLIAIYCGMLIGEWDSNLLNGNGYIEVVINGETKTVFCEDATFRERVAYIDKLRAEGDNRYLKAFLYYYLGRWLVLLLISNISYGVSNRAFKLLLVESNNVREKEKMQSELDVATSIQLSVLPKPLDKENIYGLMNPARSVGGDFYDFFYIDQNYLAIVISDVSGKGIPAALFMMKTETLIKSLTTSFKHDTAHIMKRCNELLCNNNEAEMFVTSWLGILNLSSGELKYTNAGHTKPLLIKNGKAEFVDDKPDLVLGAMEGIEYHERTINLDKGDKICLYTDGITEAHNINNELYGQDRLFEFATKNAVMTPQNFTISLRKDIEKFSGDAEQFDDVTILTYEFSNDITMTESRIFNADVKELNNLFDYTSSLLKMLEFSNRDIIMINTALEEVFVNVANYAYEVKGTVEVTLSKCKNRVSFIFKDNGKPFNPLTREDPNINASSSEREIGGLGIYMVKKIMDEVTYDYLNGQNVLTLVKIKNYQ